MQDRPSKRPFCSADGMPDDNRKLLEPHLYSPQGYRLAIIHYRARVRSPSGLMSGLNSTNSTAKRQTASQLSNHEPRTMHHATNSEQRASTRAKLSDLPFVFGCVVGCSSSNYSPHRCKFNSKRQSSTQFKKTKRGPAFRAI